MTDVVISCDEETAARIERAAGVEGKTVSAFILEAAAERASSVQVDRMMSTTVFMSSEAYEEALDHLAAPARVSLTAWRQIEKAKKTLRAGQ